MKKLFLSTIAIILFISCQDRSQKKIETSAKDSLEKDTSKTAPVNTTTKDGNTAGNNDSVLFKLTANILGLMRDKNYPALTNYIHPTEGVRFSPYAYVDTINNKKFSRSTFQILINKPVQDTILWGNFDGSGDPIKMTINDYMKKFVYDVDFAKPEKRSVNKFMGHGNSLNNLLSVYKNCHFTESYFSGFDKKYVGMDWRTLRLVFKELNGNFFLVGIVHDQWTS